MADLQIDPDTGEIGSDVAIDVLVHQNPIATAAFVLNSRAQVDLIKTHIAKMAAKVKTLESNAERAKSVLMVVMQMTGTQSIKSDDGTFKAVLMRERDVSVDVFDLLQLPPDYQREIPARYEPDKALIKRALLDGYDVPGATLVRKDRLQIG